MESSLYKRIEEYMNRFPITMNNIYHNTINSELYDNNIIPRLNKYFSSSHAGYFDTNSIFPRGSIHDVISYEFGTFSPKDTDSSYDNYESNEYTEFVEQYRDKDLVEEIVKLDKDVQFEEKYSHFLDMLRNRYGDEHIHTQEGEEMRDLYKYAYLYSLMKNTDIESMFGSIEDLCYEV